MHWANIKDFPDFYHLDTLLITSPKPTNSNENLYPSLYQRQIPLDNNSFIKKPQKPKPLHIPSRSEDIKLPLISSRINESISKTSENQHLYSKIQGKIRTRNFLHQSTDELKSINISLRTKEFLNHLNNLSKNVPFHPNHNPRKYSVNKMSFLKKTLKSPLMHKNLSQNPLFSISLENKDSSMKNDKKINKNKKNFRFKQRIYEKKKTSMISRTLIPHYMDLREQITKFVRNLNEMKEIISNSKKIYGFLKSFLVYKNTSLRKILLNKENETLNEPMIENSLEEKCFYKEIYYEGIGIQHREKMEPNIIIDFKELNEKIEVYNTSNAIEKIKIMEQVVIDEFHKMKVIEQRLQIHKNRNLIFRDYKPIEKFNYKNIPVTKLVEEINNFEKNHGECEYILNRSRLICEAIETSVKNVRSECEN